MAHKTAAALRQLFLDYFSDEGHTVVSSAPLVPQNDPTLLFTNAGMVQFKDVFVGAETRAYNRAATSQKCMRVSGKHNDLEEVGRTARHHTFFEMLGNFSFGDYFKEGAIELAWKLLTRELAMDPAKIWVTVFGGAEGIPADAEARALWKKISGLPDERILDRGMKDNFWAMGDTGPCGPCTEIHYDLRPAGAGRVTDDDFDSGRVVEFWNNVFMQFERHRDGRLVPLPKPSVDTGMGLERLTAIVQGESSNYHTDLFAPLLSTIAEAAGKPYRGGDGDDDVSMRVIADHARATSFLVADGIQPANEGRGYVLRRIMRRAIRHGKRLGFEDLFFDRACLTVVDTMGKAYPELVETRALIEKVAQNEEQRFRRTLDTGLSLLEQEIGRLRAERASRIPGEVVFKLYDTYGFPKDLTEVIAAENELHVDDQGFEAAMEEQRRKSTAEGGVGDAAVEGVFKAIKERLGRISFIGYPHETIPPEKREGTWRTRDARGVTYLEARCTVRALVREGGEIERGREGEVLDVVLDPTPFYGESGGQVGDRGVIVGASNGAGKGAGDLLLEVTATNKPLDDLTVCTVRVLRGKVAVGDEVWAGYDPQVRRMTRAHHSATHLLHGALRKVLGEHVKQQGSLVDPDHLRFDFSHFVAPTAGELRAVEDDANRRVTNDHQVITDVLPFAEAKAKGAIAMFGEKYGDVVRVLTMGESVEFCGGTHVSRTGDIGLVLVQREEAVAAGVRRIEAEVGDAARARSRDTQSRLERAAGLLQSSDGADLVAKDDPILAAVAKAVRQHHDFAAELRSAGQESSLRVGGPIEVPKLSHDVDLAEARRVRDQWQGLVRLSNARSSDASAIAGELLESHPELADGGIIGAYARLLTANREDERRLQKVQSSELGSRVDELVDGAEVIGGVRLITASLEGVDGKGLRDLADRLRDRLDSGIVALCSTSDGKAALLIAVTEDLEGRFGAGALIKELAPIIGGRGGGKPQLAQAGGSAPEKAGELFARLREKVRGT